jgi:hypothetical protein
VLYVYINENIFNIVTSAIFKRSGEELALVYFKLLFNHSLRVTEKNHKNSARVGCAMVEIKNWVLPI